MTQFIRDERNNLRALCEVRRVANVTSACEEYATTIVWIPDEYGGERRTRLLCEAHIDELDREGLTSPLQRAPIIADLETAVLRLAALVGGA